MSKVEESMKSEMAKQTQLQIQAVLEMSMKKTGAKHKIQRKLSSAIKSSMAKGINRSGTGS